MNIEVELTKDQVKHKYYIILFSNIILLITITKLNAHGRLQNL